MFDTWEREGALLNHLSQETAQVPDPKHSPKYDCVLKGLFRGTNCTAT